DSEICYCSHGQRATASPFAAQFRVRADKFRWLRGKDLIAFCDAPILRDPARIVDPSPGLVAPGCHRFFRRSIGSDTYELEDGDIPAPVIDRGEEEGKLTRSVGTQEDSSVRYRR